MSLGTSLELEGLSVVRFNDTIEMICRNVNRRILYMFNVVLERLSLPTTECTA
jgi:hypothetical protein